MVIITLIVIYCSGCKQREVGADLDSKALMDKAIMEISQRQETSKLQESKYQYEAKKEIDEITYEVHEFVRSDGGIGYHIIMTKIIDGKTYKKVQSQGDEKEDRTQDWALLDNNPPSEAISKTQ
jgi:hypothetical protein